jgi:hypothetical protein
MSVQRRILPIAAGIVAMIGATPTRAASPAADFASGSAVISAEQVVPIVAYNSTTTTSAGGGKTTNSATSIALVTGGAVSASQGITGLKTLPRLAFDYVFSPGISVGGSAWVFANLSVTQDSTPAGGGSTVSTDQPKATYWGFAPRVGYAVALTDLLAVWPRVGIEYGDVEVGSVTRNGITTPGGSINQLSLDVEGMIVITPVHHFGITIGPIAAIPLTGKVSSTVTVTGLNTSTTTSNDISMWYVALSLGVLGYF